MKKLIYISIFAFLPLLSMAQIGNFEEVVYLKNGTVIRGVIIEQVLGVSLKIKTRDQNIFAFDINEVEKITREELLPPAPPHQPHFHSHAGHNHDGEYSYKPKPFVAHSRYKPSGAYLLFGFNGGANKLGRGLGVELTVGGKIFRRGETTRFHKTGAEVWLWGGINGGSPRFGRQNDFEGNIQVGLNAGPTTAIRLRGPSYFFITPYSGVNVILARRNFFDNNLGGNTIQEDIGATVPVGLKLEFTRKRFFIGNNTAVGGMLSTDGFGGYFRTTLNLGVKF